MKKCFTPKSFYRKTADLLAECDAIRQRYVAEGAEGRELLQTVSDRWDQVKELVQNRP